MTTRAAFRLFKALSRWTPPPGITHTVHYDPFRGELWVTYTDGQHECRYTPVNPDPRVTCSALYHCGVLLLSKISREPRRYPIDEAAEPLPDWLGCAYDALTHVARHAPCVDGVVDYAAELLRSIEADSFPEPTVTGTAEGGIELWWEHDGRRLIVQVQGPGRILVRCRIGDQWSGVLVTGRYCYPAFLAAAEWLRPGHVGPVDRSLWERPVRARIDCGGDK